MEDTGEGLARLGVGEDKGQPRVVDGVVPQRFERGTERFADTLAAHSLQPETTIARGGNFAVHGTPDEARPGSFAATSVMAVSSTGLLLRGAGSTKDQIERTAWLFGFDTSRIAGMAAQTRAHDARLADTLSQFG